MGFFSGIENIPTVKNIPAIKNMLEERKKAKGAKEKAEREYAAKQASVATEIVESSNGKLSKNSLKTRKGRSSGSGGNLV